MNQSLKSGTKVIVLSLGLVFALSLHAQENNEIVAEDNKELKDESWKAEPFGRGAKELTAPAPMGDGQIVPTLYSIISKIFVVLVILSGVSFAVIRYAKKGKLNLGSLKPLGTTDSLIISETRALGNKQYIMVVEYNTRKLLLGISPSRIDHLCFLDSAFEENVSESDFSEEQ